MKPKIDEREIVGCLSKITYSTEDSAKFFAKADSLDYYKCLYCEGYHLTAKPAVLAGYTSKHEPSIGQSKTSVEARPERRPSPSERRKLVLFRKQWRASQRKRCQPATNA